MADPLFDLTGRVALITGASRGIGRAIALAFSRAGAAVAISSRQAADLELVQRDVTAESSVRCEYLPADLTQRTEVEALARWALATFGRIDILVNNAGNTHSQYLVDTTDEAWDQIFALDLTSCMQLARALAPAMIEHKWGRIIHISSLLACASNRGCGAYSAAKAGLLGMARAHALELGPFGVTVNCIAPGLIRTDLALRELNAEVQQRYINASALKRIGEVVDCVGPALLLASDAGAYITGTQIVVDGGVLGRTF